MALFEQRSWGHRVSVELGETDLRYSSSDGGVSFGFRVPYEAFDLVHVAQLNVPAPKVGAILMFCTFLATVMIFAWYRPDTSVIVINASVIGLFGLALLIWRFTRLFSIRFNAYYQVDGYEVGTEAFRLIRDEQFDEIVRTITVLRRERLRQLWAASDFGDDLAMERGRLDWLLANDVIDADEHAQATRRMLTKASGREPPERLH